MADWTKPLEAIERNKGQLTPEVQAMLLDLRRALYQELRVVERMTGIKREPGISRRFGPMTERNTCTDTRPNGPLSSRDAATGAQRR
jgi:hypothetical protein